MRASPTHRRRGPERAVTSAPIRDGDGDWYVRLSCGHRWYEVGGRTIKAIRDVRLCPLCPDETYNRTQYRAKAAAIRERHQRLFFATRDAIARAEGVLEELRQREAAE